MKKESKVKQAKYVELNLFPEEKVIIRKTLSLQKSWKAILLQTKSMTLTDLFAKTFQISFSQPFPSL